jgi:hypothetical protein
MVNPFFGIRFVVILIRFIAAASQRRAGFPGFPACARERGGNEKYFTICATNRVYPQRRMNCKN